MNRRDLLRGLVGASVGLVLPPSVAESAEDARRWWSLGAMPGRDPKHHVVYLYDVLTGRETIFVNGETAQVYVRGIERYADYFALQHVKVPTHPATVSVTFEWRE